MDKNLKVNNINFSWVLAAITDWLLIIFAMYLGYLSYWFLPISLFVIGNRQHALAILGHDGAHRLISKNKTLNDFLTNFFVFYPMTISIKNYREFHWEHHRETNTTKDPELPLKNTPLKIDTPITKSKIAFQAAGDLIGLGILQIFTFLYKIRPKKAIEYLPMIIVVTLSAILGYFGFGYAILLWNISLLTTFWLCFRLRVWSEHVGLKEGETLKFDPKWWQKIIFLPHNTWLHAEHHEKPGIPFNKLPILRKEEVGLTLSQARKYQNGIKKI